MIPPILLPLQFDLPPFSVYMLICLAGSIATSSGIAALAWGNPWRLMRPGLLFALFAAIFFQWPTVFLAQHLQDALPNAWFFATVVNGVPLFLVGWAYLTRSSDIAAGPIPPPRLTWWQMAVPVALTLFFGILFLLRVPFDCTALYALAVEPKLTLLARELSVKLAGSSFATYGYGALANTTAPAVLAIAGTSIAAGIAARSFKPLLIWPAIIVVVVMLVMLSGAKGLFIPSFLLIVISAAIWNRTLIGKVGSIVAVVVILGASLTALEVARERNPDSAEGYNFARCSVQLGTCAESKRLLASLLLRKDSLGLSVDQITHMQKELESACQGGTDELPVPSAPPNWFGPLPPLDWAGRMLAYAWGIAYRAVIVPAQVASWHYLYVAEFGSPGIAALPFGRHMTGASVNMPELVYQAYGSVFSGGDRTSTSTSPTSFALAYPAYLGWSGLALVLALIVLLDALCAFVMRRLPGMVLPLAAGLMTIICMNLVLSEYLTVLFTHGGAVGIALLAFFAATKDRASLKRFVDVAMSSVLIALLAIPALLIALMVRLRLGAPVLFVQERPGHNAVLFRLYKFRTMVDARDAQGNLKPDSERLTRFGRLLRASSLDELPELWNVLKGDMSLVGPRPLLTEYVPLYTEEQSRRHAVRPGLTGLAQVSGRNALDWESRFKLDVWYVDNQSFWLDLKIMWRTLAKVLSREGVRAEGEATMSKFTGTRA